MQLQTAFYRSVVLLAASLAPPLLEAATVPDPPRSVAVLELFTSEGCSSCPPADALLRQINLKQTSSGQLIIGISEHVNYWDDLGWKDPFSLPILTDRQSVYAARLSPDGSYTPQMVLNGRTQFVGSDRRALAQALREDAHREHLNLQILSSSHDTKALSVQFALNEPPKKPLDIIAVVVDDADQSSILRGENRGKELQHVAVARFIGRAANVRDRSTHSVHVPLPQNFASVDPRGHHLILFAQEPGQGAILAGAVAPF